MARTQGQSVQVCTFLTHIHSYNDLPSRKTAWTDSKSRFKFWILYFVFCILYFVFCILYSVFCILYFLFCFCILYFVFCILYFVFCILYLYFIFCILYFLNGYGCNLFFLKYSCQWCLHWNSLCHAPLLLNVFRSCLA